ncbi:glycoside hydrolase family 95 protein [bacterium]|nr:glycoside hydrolase family 95 protein [bacterium]
MRKVFGIPVLAFCFLSILIHDITAQTEKGLSSVDPAGRAGLHPIVSDRPAVNFFEGAVLGNGGLGAIVTTRPDAVVIYFGHNDVWDIRLAENNKEKIGTFRELFEKVKAIPDTVSDLSSVPWFRDYLEIMAENYRKPYPRPFPCGSLVLWFDRREAELIGHRLSIDTGVCEINFLVDGRRVRFELFTDMTADRLWGRMVDDSGKPAASPFVSMSLAPDPETPKELPEYTSLKYDTRGLLSFRQILPFEEITETRPYKAHPKDRAFCLTAGIGRAFAHIPPSGDSETHPDGGPWIPGQASSTKTSEGLIDHTQPFFLCVQLDDGLASAVGLNSADMPSPDRARYDDAAKKSQVTWNEFWSRSGVVLDDDILERTWYHNLYFLRCSVRPGVTCPGLFANWSFRNIGTAWHGDYHMNYNTQQPFWVTFSSNHADLHLPYVDMVERTLLPVSKKWAREYYDMRGAFFPHSAYPVEMSIMPYPLPTWGWEVFETPWSVQSLWWHYTYTMDTEFLRKRAFPVIREAVLFLVDYMKRPEAHGSQWGDDKYHVFPSVPPELYGLQPGFDKNYDTIADLALTRFVFDAYLEACTILESGQEERELMSDVRDILAHFPDYPTARSQRGEVFVSVKGENPEVVYNVPVSLMTVFPGEEHGLHSSPEEYKIAVNTFNNQQNEGGNELVFLNVQAARLGILDLEKFKRQIEYCLIPNGTCIDKVLQIHGRYTNGTPYDWMGLMGNWFENFSLPLVIDECLLQSYNGELRLFPNWQKDKDAEFRTLRAVGAFLVSARMSGGSVQWIEITSEAGQPLTMISPWKKGAVCLRAQGKTVLTGERFTITTSTGERIIFKPNNI